jgi:hypothetical protein
VDNIPTSVVHGMKSLSWRWAKLEGRSLFLVFFVQSIVSRLRAQNLGLKSCRRFVLDVWFKQPLDSFGYAVTIVSSFCPQLSFQVVKLFSLENLNKWVFHF